MALDNETLLVRAGVARDLLLLASPADDQIEYFRHRGIPREELYNEWMHWDTAMIPQLVSANALTPEIERLVEAITETMESFGSESRAEIERVGNLAPHFDMYSESAIRHGSRWAEIRSLSSEALAAFHRLGVVTLGLNDDDYNKVLPPDRH
jgi:hypothetical protein